MKFSDIPHNWASISIALLFTGAIHCNAGWALSTKTGPYYDQSANQSSTYYTSSAIYDTGTLSADDTSIELTLGDMRADCTAEMGCVNNLLVADVSTNSWIQAAGSGTWTWAGGSTSTTTVSNYYLLSGLVHTLLQAQPSLGSTASGSAWAEGGTNGNAPDGWTRALVRGWVTNNSPSGFEQAHNATWNTGYPIDDGQTGVGWGTCNGTQESCNQDEVIGYFSIDYETTIYTITSGTPSTSFVISADIATTVTIGGTGGSAYAEADSKINNGGLVLAYLLN
jgi:hypothetical protein